MNIPFIQAKKLSYSGTRSYSNIYYIIIHYTGISNDTAENNCKYFAGGNKKSAGAHFFVDQKGRICQSIKMSYTANSVPRKRQAWSGGGTLVGKCISANSISIEMCDNLTKDPSPAQTEAVRQLVEYIQSVCPNAKTIVRHYDVTGKFCPARMRDEKKWAAFKAAISRKSATSSQQPKPAAPAKSVEVIAKEVIAGQWGVGADRRKRLEAAGYNYQAVQDQVNLILKGTAKRVVYYTVKRGDTLTTIANRYGVPVSRIAQENNIPDINKIRVAQILKITL